MKAKYILEAIEAMRAAEALTCMTPPCDFGGILAKLSVARIHLKVFSGLSDVEVPVEHEEAQ